MLRKMMMIASLLLPMAAMAGQPAPQVVRKAMAKLVRGVSITHVGPAPMPGFYQALVDGRMVYVSEDGKYVMAGQLYAAPTARNLTEAGMAVIRRQALAKIPLSDRIIYAPPHPKYTVTVFTDLDCGYCRMFHHQIATYNAMGIAVQYLFWPRSGIKAVPSGRDTPSYLKAVSVWCAKDRKKAFDAAKQGLPIPAATCQNPVAREYQLGRSIGVDGTPIIIAEDGTMVGGYLPPHQLLQALEAEHKRQAATEAPPRRPLPGKE